MNAPILFAAAAASTNEAELLYVWRQATPEAKVIIDPHNYGRYKINENGSLNEYVIDNAYGGVTKVSRQDFADFWTPAEGGDGPVAEFVGSLDQAASSRLRDAVRSAYLDGEADGPRSYAATAWVVKGEVP